jgi:hypothetical protein
MNRRFAGENLAAALAVGVPTAVAAHAVSHDDMDYMAQDFKNLNRDFEAMSPTAQKAYIAITAKNRLSGMDRQLVGMALAGEISAPKEIKTEGDLAVAQAAALRVKAPKVAAEVARLNQQELDLVVKEIDSGTTPQAVISSAQNEGAGVSPAPAVIGGGLGTAAALAALGRRAYG